MMEPRGRACAGSPRRSYAMSWATMRNARGPPADRVPASPGMLPGSGPAPRCWPAPRRRAAGPARRAANARVRSGIAPVPDPRDRAPWWPAWDRSGSRGSSLGDPVYRHVGRQGARRIEQGQGVAMADGGCAYRLIEAFDGLPRAARDRVSLRVLRHSRSFAWSAWDQSAQPSACLDSSFCRTEPFPAARLHTAPPPERDDTAKEYAHAGGGRRSAAAEATRSGLVAALPGARGDCVLGVSPLPRTRFSQRE